MSETVIEPQKLTLAERMEALQLKYYVPGNIYLIVTVSIIGYQKMKTEEKDKIARNEKKITKALMTKFNPLVIYMNAGKIVIVFDRHDKGNHKFQGRTNLISGAITSFLVHTTVDILDDLWFSTSCYGESNYKKAYSYLLYAYRRTQKIKVQDYLKSFDKDELSPVEFKKVSEKLDYVFDLVGIEYDEEENTGHFTKYRKEENPESKFGFDRVVKHLKRDIYFRDYDIDYIMRPILDK